MTRRWCGAAVCAAILLTGARADAQFGVTAGAPATGETYRVELMGGLWKPSFEGAIASDDLQVVGTRIDLVGDLGMEQARFRELRLVLRPARKHKFRVQYLPITYEGDRVIARTLVFNAQRFDVGLPVRSSVEWKAWRFGYEYDFVYRDRWFLGFIAEAKYTDATATLRSPLSVEQTSARAPIPAIGGIVRAYPAYNVGLTFELTGFKLPSRLSEDYQGRYIDWDLYTSLNFSDHFGLQIGYRSIDLNYLVDTDTGDFRLKGLYYAGVVRF